MQTVRFGLILPVCRNFGFTRGVGTRTSALQAASSKIVLKTIPNIRKKK